MRFGIASVEGVSVWAAARLQDEGHNVLLYHLPPHNNPFATPAHRHSGEGLIPLAKTWEQFLAWNPDLVYFDCTDFGDRADALRRRGVPVFGSCKLYDRLEKEREFGFNVARQIGMEVPEYFTFGSVTETLGWLEKRKPDERWYFKTDRELGAAFTAGGDRDSLIARLKWIRGHKGDRIKHLLQREVVGAEIMTSTYWNGITFIPPFMGTLEKKAFGNDETGPKTGCSCNVVWMYEDVPKIVDDEGWEKLAKLFRHEQVAPGNVDINAIVSFDDGKAYFLEWTPRLGIDSEPTAQRLLEMEYGEFIWKLCDGTLPVAPFRTDESAYSLRLSVPPYPFEPQKIDEQHSPIGLALLGVEGSLWGARRSDRFVAYGVMEREGGYACADPYGLIGISSATGEDLETMHKSCVKYARSLEIADLAYRTDGEIALKKDLAAVRKAGHEAPLL